MKRILLILLILVVSCNKEDDTETEIIGKKFDDFDNTNDFTVQGNKWNKSNLTFAFDFGFNSSQNLDKMNAIRSAIQTWDNAISSFTITEIQNPNQADMVFGFGGISHGSCPHNFSSNALAHGFFPPPNAGSLAGDVHINNTYDWSTNNTPNTFDFETVCLHEIGHALGLKHSNDINSVMTTNYRGTRRSLTQDDFNGICQIYQCNTSTQFPELLLNVNFDNNNLNDVSGNNFIPTGNSTQWNDMITPIYVNGINGSALKIHNQNGGTLAQTYLNYIKNQSNNYQNITYSFWLKIDYSDQNIANALAFMLNTAPLSVVNGNFQFGIIQTPGLISYSDKQWHHISVRQNIVNSELYIDGNLVRTDQNFSTPNYSNQGVGLYFSNFSANNGYVIHYLDQLKIYKGYLSTQQISYLYQNHL